MDQRSTDAAQDASPGSTAASQKADRPLTDRPTETEPSVAGGNTTNDATVSVSDSPLSNREPSSTWQNFARLLGCNLIVFVTSVCIMVLELTATRLIAKHHGSSLYTWTSVIGVVLTGITLGNYVGGWLADRVNHRKALAWLFLLSSVLCFAVLWLDQNVSNVSRPNTLSWPAWILCVVAAIYLLPSMAMGTISPLVASMALSGDSRTGITVGNVYAWGALGSIVGTFLAGFFLIDTFGTRAIVAMTSATLAAMGVLVASGQVVFRTAVLCGWLQLVLFVGLIAAGTAESLGSFTHSISNRTIRVSQAIGGFFSDSSDDPVSRDEADDERAGTSREWRDWGATVGRHLHEIGIALNLRNDDPDEYHDESNYSYINVGIDYQEDADVKFLRLDKLDHSYYNPEAPTELYYEYESVYAAVTEQAVAQTAGVSSVTIPHSPELDELIKQLPSWATYDARRSELTIDGTLDLRRLEELRDVGPFGAYWVALTNLQRNASVPSWGGFDSVYLESWPDGISIPDELLNKISYDPAANLINVYEPLSPVEIEQLALAGEADRFADYFHAVQSLYERSRRINTLFIGGGGFIFPRWIEAKFSPGSLIDVAELDPAVKLAVQLELGLPPDDETAVRTHIGDARNYVDDRIRENRELKQSGQSPILYDFAYGDAFNDFSVPWHLTTKEFTQKVRDLLNPNGVYLVNVIDIYPRTEAPEQQTDEEGNYIEFSGRIPHELLQASTTYLEWEECSDEFDGIEVIQVADDEGYRISVRGIMPAAQRDRLIQLDPQNQEFTQAIHEMYDRSRQSRPGRFLASFVNTISQVFPYTYVFSSEWDGRPSDARDTFIVVGSLRQLDLLNLSSDNDYWSGQPFAWSEQGTRFGQMNHLLLTSRGMVLTDDFAPVDNLLAPVFVDQY